MKVLITGAFGQLGEALIRELTPEYTCLATGKEVPDDLQVGCPARVLDITDTEQVRRVVTEFGPDAVVNLASMTNVDACERDQGQAWEVNTRGVQYLLSAVSTTQTHFIQVSTDYVFNGREGPYDESAEPDPINVYGLTKWEAEMAVQSAMSPWLILRTNVVFGYTRRTRASFVKWVVDSLRAGQPIRVVDDQWNNPTWTVALAEVIHRCLAAKVTGLYHYGGADYLHRCDFARLVARVFNLDESLITPITTAELNQLAPRPLKSGLKSAKIESKLNIRCVSLETSLKAIYRELKS
jgi:dTDP-4-dehydrorhamnose reductase